MRIKSNEREPFIQALQKLRPDLKKTVSELDDQLGVLRDDIADLLGRLQHTDASPESEAEGRDAQGKVDDNGGLDSERGDGPQSGGEGGEVQLTRGEGPR